MQGRTICRACLKRTGGAKPDNTNAATAGSLHSKFYTAEEVALVKERPQGGAMFDLLLDLAYVQLARIQHTLTSREEGLDAGRETESSETTREVLASSGTTGTGPVSINRQKVLTKEANKLPDYRKLLDTYLGRLSRLMLQQEEYMAGKSRRELHAMLGKYREVLEHLGVHVDALVTEGKE